MTKFKSGDVIEALEAMQGVQTGERYIVKRVKKQNSIFGLYVEYELTKLDIDGSEFSGSRFIKNAHLLFRKV